MGVFDDRDFRLLFGGQTVSEFGSSITFYVLPFVALGTIGASNFQLGVLVAAGNAAWLVVALPAGAWIDRVRRRPVMIGCDLVSVGALVTVPFAVWAGWLTYGQLLVVAFVLSVAAVVFDIAYPAFVPSIVPPDRLVPANGALEAGANGARLLGTNSGGLLAQFIGPPAALLADAATFVVSAATITAMGVREPRPAAPAGRPPLRRDIAEGMRLTFASRIARALTVGVTVANFVFGAYSPVVLLFLYRQLHFGLFAVSVLLAVGGVGGVVGGAVSGAVARRIGDARLLWVSGLVGVGCLLLQAIAGRGFAVGWFVAGAFLLSLAISAFNVAARAGIQRTAPPHALGRVTASIRLFSRGALPLGGIVGGLLTTLWGPRVALLALIAGYALMPLWLWASPIGRVRTMAELDA